MIQTLVYVIIAQSIIFRNDYDFQKTLYNATADNKVLVKRDAKN